MKAVAEHTPGGNEEEQKKTEAFSVKRHSRESIQKESKSSLSHIEMNLSSPTFKGGKTVDWYDTKVWNLVNDIMKLPLKEKYEATKELEKKFMDQEELDIFSEQEASYNAMLLRKKE